MTSKSSLRFCCLAILLGLLVPAAFAQKSSNAGPAYNMSAETKVKGIIDEVRETPGTAQGTILVVKTDTGTALVYVAPAEFLKEIDTVFNKNDQIEVLGCKISGSSGDEILAREITVGTNTTTLRDDKGVPVWSGWKPAKSR